MDENTIQVQPKKRGGRGRRVTHAMHRQIMEMYVGGATYEAIASRMGVTKATVHRYLRMPLETTRNLPPTMRELVSAQLAAPER